MGFNLMQIKYGAGLNRQRQQGQRKYLMLDQLPASR